MNILVICLGNINRSPLVAALLARSLDQEVRSAGFLASGKRASARMRGAAAFVGLNLDAHRSQTLSPALNKWADVVVYFSESHRKRLNENFGERCNPKYPNRWFNLAHYLKPPKKSIDDPAFNGKRFVYIFEELVVGSEALAKELKKLL